MYSVPPVSIEEINGTVYSVGRWLAVVGVLGIPIHTFILFSMLTNRSNLYIAGVPLIVFSIPLVIIYLIALIKVRKLKDVSGDDLFSTGPIVVIAGVIFSLITSLLLMSGFLNFSPEIPFAIFQPLFFFTWFMFMSIANLIVLVGNIIVAIAFWHFGEMNKSNLIRLGAVLQAFLSVMFLNI